MFFRYEIWCSTEHGNKRLDAAWREREGKVSPFFACCCVFGIVPVYFSLYYLFLWFCCLLVILLDSWLANLYLSGPLYLLWLVLSCLVGCSSLEF